MDLGATWRFGVLVALCWLVLLFLLLPALITVPVSLTPTRFLSLPAFGDYSLQHYEALIGSPEWRASLWQSLVVGVCATALAVVLGTLCAIGMWRIASRFTGSIRNLILVPMIMPPIVSALAMYRAWVDFGLYDSIPGVVIAHTIIAAPFVVITVTASLTTIDPRIEQASRSLGASVWVTAWRVILPSIRPGLWSGAVFAFIISWDEIVITLFVSSRNVYTLPRRMWDGIRESVDPTVAAVATILIAFTCTIVLATLLQQFRRANRERGS